MRPKHAAMSTRVYSILLAGLAATTAAGSGISQAATVNLEAHWPDDPLTHLAKIPATTLSEEVLAAATARIEPFGDTELPFGSTFTLIVWIVFVLASVMSTWAPRTANLWERYVARVALASCRTR